MTCAFADPREWLLEIAPTIQAQCWQESQLYTTSSSRWRAYMNQICLHAFLSWTEEDSISASVWQSFPGMRGFWEFVNGTPVSLEGRRVVLIPSEAIDDNELEVPQEWVDIPSWVADYYLAVQVQPDGDSVRIHGYITHAELKSKGSYDPVDRTYCVGAQHIIKDFNAFWVSYQFCTSEVFKAAVPSLPELSITQAENLLQRLNDDTVTFPRLAVPFTTWGALLENQQWRQRLYSLKLKQAPVNLSNWLKGTFDNLWNSVETLFASNNGGVALNFRDSVEVGAVNVKRAKTINLGTEVSQEVVLIVTLNQEDNQLICIRVQLHSDRDNAYLPSNIKLAVLLESGEIIQEVQAREQDNYIQLNRFEGETGESFKIQVSLDDYQITENFMI